MLSVRLQRGSQTAVLGRFGFVAQWILFEMDRQSDQITTAIASYSKLKTAKK